MTAIEKYAPRYSTKDQQTNEWRIAVRKAVCEEGNPINEAVRVRMVGRDGMVLEQMTKSFKKSDSSVLIS